VVVPPVTTARVIAPPRFDYPAARRTDDADVLHGVRVPDPYRWLEADSAETRVWFEAEDQRARRVLATVPGTKEMIAALKPLYANPMPRLGMRRGNVTFIRKGPKLTMKADDARAGESVIFDESQHADDGVVTRWLLSRDGGHVLVEQAKNGLDRRSAVLVESKTGRVLERLVGLEGSEIAWSRAGFFYGYAPPDVPHADRFGQRSIRFHAVGTEQATDRVVVPPAHDKNASSSAMNPVAVTKDGARLVVQTSGNWQRSTFGVIDLTKSDWKLVALAVDAAIVVENDIYVRTQNEIGRIRAMSPTPERVMPAPAELLDLDTMGPYAVVKRAARMGETTSGFVHRDFYDASWKKLSELDTPRGMTDSFFSPGPDAPKLVVTREGLGFPARRRELDPRTGAQTELHAANPDWPTTDFRIDTLEAKSRDGTRIPITILRRNDTPVDGTAALALYGYGGFRNSAEQIFYPGWMIWPRTQGRVFAQCHMRGGVEFGPAWHHAGAVRNRQQTLDDFHACLEALHAAHYSTPGRTVIQGWSHGGMMVTAAALQRPELQRVVIAQAPLEDMIRYVHFGRGGITEYGDPDDADDFRALLGFSPYANVKEGVAYPAFFVTSPSADERVHPMHPRKIVAALQHASTGGEVLLKVLWDAGHLGGAKDDANEVMAEAWAFALSKMDP
jgi:prolyl oligopeptidase